MTSHSKVPVERGMLFSAPMFRAILDGRKTMTRRVVKFPLKCKAHGASINGIATADAAEILQYCPYGQPGDRLWVREAWRVGKGYDDLPGSEINGTSIKIWYEADGSRPTLDWVGRYRHARFMPRWASRITLEITAVRVERLQDISAQDAIAEGVNVHPDHHGKPRDSIYGPVRAFRELWASINGPGSWALNPWVWVIKYRRV